MFPLFTEKDVSFVLEVTAKDHITEPVDDLTKNSFFLENRFISHTNRSHFPLPHKKSLSSTFEKKFRKKVFFLAQEDKVVQN